MSPRQVEVYKNFWVGDMLSEGDSYVDSITPTTPYKEIFGKTWSNKKWTRSLKHQFRTIPLLCTLLIYPIRPRETYINAHKEACKRIFIAALWVMAKVWKQHKCPSVREWMSKWQYIPKMEYYTTIKPTWSVLYFFYACIFRSLKQNNQMVLLRWYLLLLLGTFFWLFTFFFLNK